MIWDITSSIMRTTIDIDGPLLDEIRRIRDQEGKSMGQVVSDLLAQALASRRDQSTEPTQLRWTARSLGAQVDFNDKEALYRRIEGPEGKDTQ
jgi:hypothetical protein